MQEKNQLEIQQLREELEFSQKIIKDFVKEKVQRDTSKKFMEDYFNNRIAQQQIPQQKQQTNNSKKKNKSQSINMQSVSTSHLIQDLELAESLYKVSTSIQEMKQNYKEDNEIIDGGLSSLIKMVDSALINAKVKDGIVKIMQVKGGQSEHTSLSKSRSASREKSQDHKKLKSKSTKQIANGVAAVVDPSKSLKKGTKQQSSQNQISGNYSYLYQQQQTPQQPVQNFKYQVTDRTMKNSILNISENDMVTIQSPADYQQIDILFNQKQSPHEQINPKQSHSTSLLNNGSFADLGNQTKKSDSRQQTRNNNNQFGQQMKTTQGNVMKTISTIEGTPGGGDQTEIHYQEDESLMSKLEKTIQQKKIQQRNGIGSSYSQIKRNNTGNSTGLSGNKTFR